MSLRDSSKDEVVNIPWKDEGRLSITIPANTNVVLDMIGVGKAANSSRPMIRH
jgi:hypothetical protein